MDNTSESIVVTGLGIYSPIGKNVDQAVDSLLNSRSGLSQIDVMDTENLRNGNGGMIDDIEPIDTLTGMRANLLLKHACQEGIEHSGLMSDNDLDLSRVGVSIGTSLGGYGGFVDLLYEQTYAKDGRQFVSTLNPHTKLSQDEVIKNIPPVLLAYEIANQYKFSGGISSSVTACSASANGLALACDMIHAGRLDYVVAGGVDPLTQLTYLGFNALMAMTKSELRTLDQNRSGLLIGEGAACMVFERESSALRRGAKIYARLKGFGVSNDAYHCTQPHPEAGGAVLAIEQALAQANLQPSDIDYVNMHGTGTKHNDLMELKALQQVFHQRMSSLPISSSKSMMGHTLGAAGAIESVISILALDKGFLPPNINYSEHIDGFDYNLVQSAQTGVELRNVMSNSFGFGGNCAALIFGK